MQESLDWQLDGLCLNEDPEIFFQTETIAEAKKICNDCPVRKQCLEYANIHEANDGVFGGLTGAERFQLRKQIKKLNENKGR